MFKKKDVSGYSHGQPLEISAHIFLFLSFEFRTFEIVSDFGFRYSNLSQ
jgi:hypothetical protein